MLEDFYVYDTAAAKLATSASERTTLTHELEEIHESASALKRAWDTMKDLAKQDVDDREWHKTLLDKLRVDAKFNANVIGIFGADAAAEITKEINQGDEGAAHSLHDLRERMRNAGEMSNDLIEKSIRRMKGHHWEASVEGKIINLRRISNLNATALRSALVQHLKHQKVGMLESVTLLPLRAGDIPRVDALREIKLLNAKHDESRDLVTKRLDRLEKEIGIVCDSADFARQLAESGIRRNEALEESVKAQVAAAKSEAVAVNQRIEWRKDEVAPDHPWKAKSRVLTFDGNVIEAIVLVSDFSYAWDHDREDNEIGGIAAALDITKDPSDPKKVLITANPHMFDFGDHQAHHGRLRYIVIARTTTP